MAADVTHASTSSITTSSMWRGAVAGHNQMAANATFGAGFMEKKRQWG